MPEKRALCSSAGVDLPGHAPITGSEEAPFLRAFPGKEFLIIMLAFRTIRAL
jgi:hypothetical protein